MAPAPWHPSTEPYDPEQGGLNLMHPRPDTPVDLLDDCFDDPDDDEDGGELLSSHGDGTHVDDNASGLPELEDLRADLRRFLRERDLSQRDAARTLGVALTTLQRVESGSDVRYSTGVHLLTAMRAFDREPFVSPDAPISQVATDSVVCLSKDVTLGRAEKSLATRRIAHAPLLLAKSAYGRLVSLERVQDLLAAGVDSEDRVSEHLAKATVAPAPVLDEDAPIADAIARLARAPLCLVRRARTVRGVVTAANLHRVRRPRG